MTESEINEIIQKLVNECKWHFDNAIEYYSKQTEFNKREIEIIKPLGLKAYKAGGLPLMKQIYQAVDQECLMRFGKRCRSALDMKWNGVGEWRG